MSRLCLLCTTETLFTDGGDNSCRLSGSFSPQSAQVVEVTLDKDHGNMSLVGTLEEDRIGVGRAPDFHSDSGGGFEIIFLEYNYLSSRRDKMFY